MGLTSEGLCAWQRLWFVCALVHGLCHRRISRGLPQPNVPLSIAAEAFALCADESRTDEYFQKAKKIDERIQLFKERIVVYNERERLFHLPLTQYSSMTEIIKSFEPCQSLWTVAYKFSQSYPQWHEGLFGTLDPEVSRSHTFTRSRSRPQVK